MAPIEKSQQEWKACLTPAQYRVLRQHGTEPPHSSALNHVTQQGTFRCAGCDKPLFQTHAKFDSGTGWPSFFEPIAPDAVGTSQDRKFLMVRTEVHCADCHGHLGHVFDDGPQPTNLRYCINGVAMNFRPDESHGDGSNE